MKSVVITWILFAGIAMAGGSYDNIKMKSMRKGGMTETEIKEAMALPEQANIDEENAIILPQVVFHVSLDGRKAIKFEITDTIVGEVAYDLDEE